MLSDEHGDGLARVRLPGTGFVFGPQHAFAFMEQTVIFNTINYSILRGDPGNNTAMATSVNSFLCPSDPQQGNLPPGQAGENYHPSSGNTHRLRLGRERPRGFNTSLPPFNGVFYPVSNTTIAAITDGTSNTAAFSEMGLGDMSNAIATEKTDQFWTQTWPDDERPGDQPMPGISGLEPVVPGPLDRRRAVDRGEHLGDVQPRQCSRHAIMHLSAGPDHEYSQQLPPWRGEPRALRWLGPLRQELDQPGGLAAFGRETGGEVISSDSY